MLAGVLLQVTVVFQVLEHRTVLSDLLPVIGFLHLQRIDFLFQPPRFDQVVFVEHDDQQAEHHDADQPQTPVFKKFTDKFHARNFL